VAAPTTTIDLKTKTGKDIPIKDRFATLPNLFVMQLLIKACAFYESYKFEKWYSF